MNDIRSETPQPTQVNPASAQAATEDPHSLDVIAVSQMMGLETDSERTQYQNEIDTLIDWAKSEGVKDHVELKWALHALMAKLGTPELSERWITKASRYAFLSLETKKLQSQQEEMMR